MNFPIDLHVDRMEVVSFMFITLVLAVLVTIVVLLFTFISYMLVVLIKDDLDVIDTLGKYPLKSIVGGTMMFVLAISLYNSNMLETTYANVDVGHEESPYYLIGREGKSDEVIRITDDKLVYLNYANLNYALDDEYYLEENNPYTVVLGDISVDENSVANFKPTSPLGIAFLKYGEYMQNNPQLKNRKVEHDIDVDGKIKMTVYESWENEAEFLVFEGK